jgi:hypothetical protein
MKTKLVWVLLVMLTAAGVATAQVDGSHPGYYPIEEMGLLARGDLEVDVDLTGAMLQVAAGAMQGGNGGDADLARFVAGLERVRVQVGEPRGADSSNIAHTFDQAVEKMESAGWTRILRVADDGETVYLFAREMAGSIVGLTALANDQDEDIVLVNIVGDIDPVLLGKLLSNVDRLSDLEKMMGANE